ncbi:TetR/AcrR family transcriptional regulator [Bacillus sp. 165]|uniref:TetR/AcrR family transcriptional regulator n=1 Tax=Bacillus sp. 165 TaxID=1529117 RepID=UPI001AD9A469|nr:TetR/AcrR family transcriptional regulator [Bacillus sp. 165]MBO9130176.1 TetR family transcriptional regulator [Bacillus sp. 165]
MKQKIIQASIELFEKQGFAETSIQHIVDSVGVTKGAFYYHFTSKEELLLGIHHRFIDRILQQQTSIMKDLETSYSEKLHQVVTMLLQNIENNGASARVFFRELQNLTKENLPELLKKRDQFRDEIKDLVQKGIAKGEFRQELHSEMVALGVLGMCNWTYMWFDPNGSVNAEELANIFIDMILNGVAKE